MERQNYEASEEQSLHLFTPLLLVSQALGVAVIIVAAIWTGHYLGGFSWGDDDVDHMFNYHPLLMIIGMVVVYGNATLVYRVFRRENKLFIKFLHAFLQLSAFILSTIALVAVFNNHNQKGFANLYSLHSWLGLITVILFATQYAFGFTFYLFPKFSLALRQRYMPLHRYFGAALFVLACATALMGITEKMIFGISKNQYDSYSSEGVTVNLLGLLLVTLCGTVTFLLVNDNYRRLPLPEEEMIQLHPE